MYQHHTQRQDVGAFPKVVFGPTPFHEAGSQPSARTKAGGQKERQDVLLCVRCGKSLRTMMCWECLGYDEEAESGWEWSSWDYTHTRTRNSKSRHCFVCKCVNLAQTWYRPRILELTDGERFSAPCRLGVSGSLLEWLSALVTMKTLLSGGVNLSPSSFCECDRMILKRYPPIQIAVVMAGTNVWWCHH